LTTAWKVFTIKRLRIAKIINGIIWKNFDGDSSSDRKAKARPGRWKPVVSRADMKITPEFQTEPGGRGE